MTVAYQNVAYTVYQAIKRNNTLVLRNNNGSLTINPSDPTVLMNLVIGDRDRRYLERDWGIMFEDPFVKDPVVETEA